MIGTHLLPIRLYRFVISSTQRLHSCDEPWALAGGNGYFPAMDVSLIQLKAHYFRSASPPASPEMLTSSVQTEVMCGTTDGPFRLYLVL